MQIAPISFKAVHRVISGKTHGIDDNGIKTDMEMASNARKNGVDVPKYVVKEFSYETKGEKASFIEILFLKNILKVSLKIFLFSINKAFIIMT